MAADEQRLDPSGADAPGEAGPRLVFLDFEIDPVRARMRRGGVAVAIDPKPLALLVHLIEHRDRVLSREELREHVWRGVAVSDAAIASALRDVRRALGDAGAGQRIVRTVRGEGLRFVADVEVRQRAASADPFVGRTGLLDRLDGCLDALPERGGRWIWLAGDPGQGKTRTLVELARRVGSRAVPVHTGQCLEELGEGPYRPWQQVVRSLLSGVQPSDVEARFGALAAETQCLLPEREAEWTSRSHSADADRQRLLLFDATCELLRCAAAEAPFLVLLDDLHRADDATVRLLDHIVRSLAQLSVVFVAAYRSAEVDDASPLKAALGTTQPGVEHVALEPLTEAEVTVLTAAILGRDIDSELGRAVSARTQGNPLFVGEIARALGATDALASEAERIRVMEFLPTGVRAAIRARLERLPTHVENVLTHASVLGRSFDLDVLRAACHDAEADVDLAALDIALEAGLLEAQLASPGKLRFSHILVRDVLYERLPEQRRAQLHASAGRALERLRAATRSEHVAELAHHFGAAAPHGEAQRAVVYAREAGERAMRQSAYLEASQFFALALRSTELLGASNVPEASSLARATLLVGLGEAYWRAGEPDSARREFLRAAELARRAGAPEALAAAALGYAGRTDAEPVVNAKAVELLDQALAALPTEDSAAHCEVLARLGTEYYYGDSHRCDALTREAVEMAERIGDAAVLANALSARAFALMRPDVALARRISICERQIEIAGGRGETAALGLQEKFIAVLEQGDRARLDETLGSFEQLAEALRQPFFRWMATVFRGARTFLDGLLDESLRIAEDAFALGQSFGTPNAFPMFAAQLLYIRREQGRMGELEPALRTILGEQGAYPAFQSALPAMYLELGRPRDARDAFESVFSRGLDGVSRDQHWIPLLALLAPACAALRDEPRARQLYDLLAPHAGRLVVPGHGGACAGAVDHQLATLASTLSDFALADEHYDAAVTLERRAGARLFCAHSRRDWASLLWKHGTTRDRDRARDLAAEAEATYRTLGLEAFADRAAAVTQRSAG